MRLKLHTRIPPRPAPPIVLPVAAGLGTCLLSGCERAPSFNILGSVFPAWIFCILLGIIFTAVLRVVFVRTKFEPQLAPLILIYPSLAAFFAFTLWLLFFR